MPDAKLSSGSPCLADWCWWQDELAVIWRIPNSTVRQKHMLDEARSSLTNHGHSHSHRKSWPRSMHLVDSMTFHHCCWGRKKRVDPGCHPVTAGSSAVAVRRNRHGAGSYRVWSWTERPSRRRDDSFARSYYRLRLHSSKRVQQSLGYRIRSSTRGWKRYFGIDRQVIRIS